jgi:Rrf2 family protein
LVVSTRGVQGGYALARPATAISAAEIIDALEGPVAITECSSTGGGCTLESFCRVGMAWQRINLSIRKALEGVSLADLKQLREPLPPPDLQAGLRTAAASRRSTRTF